MYTFRASIYWEFFLIINLIAISTIFNAGKVSAQNTPSNEIPTPEKEADIELNVIDKLLNQPVFSPFRTEGTVKDSTRPVYVITGEEIEAQGARNVREAIRFLPGVLPDGTVGTEVQAFSGQFIRGSNSSQVLILLDGKPINNLGSGGFDLSEIPSNIIERIEVLPQAPNLFNLYANGGTYVGNPNLKPEKGDSYDVGIDQKLGTFGLLRLTYFNNTISDLIAYNSAVPVATYENIGLVRTQGIEASLNLQLASNIYAFVNYTANDPRIIKSTNSAEEDKELRFAGADSINAGISYENYKGLYAGFLMHSLGAYPTNNTNTESLPGYTTFDMKLRIPLSEQLTINGSVDNIFDQRYQLFAGYPDAGRVFQVGLNWKF